MIDRACHRNKRTSPHLHLCRPSAAWLLACVSALAAPPDWEEIGPAPVIDGSYTGRVSAVACSPTDAGKYFVAGADGGVWRTSDGGTTWTPLTDLMPTTSMGALAMDPTDEDVLYAGDVDVEPVLINAIPESGPGAIKHHP